MSIFEGMIWGGAVLTGLGLAGILWCIFTVAAAKRAGLSDAALRHKMQRVVAVNMAALAFSLIGLLAVVTGIILGR